MSERPSSEDGAPIAPGAFIAFGVVVVVLGGLFVADDQPLLGAVCMIVGAGMALYGIIAAAVAAGMKSARDDDAAP